MTEEFIRDIYYYRKKSQKTPKTEIELAEKLKKQYFDEKEGK